MYQSRHLLRQNLRAKRRHLRVSRQRMCAQALVRHLAGLPLFRAARHLAVYLPNDGEMDLTPLIQYAWRMGKCCYLPRLRNQALEFSYYTRHSILRPNRFGIPESLPNTRARAPHQLDMVLMPLVGFDRSGNRLGMGGGYYDRTFGCSSPCRQRKVVLLGIAYHLQKRRKLPVEPWDVPLWGVATERGVLKTHPRSSFPRRRIIVTRGRRHVGEHS